MELEENFIHIFPHSKIFEMQISVWHSFAPPQIHFQYGKVIYFVSVCVGKIMHVEKNTTSISAFNSGIGWFSQDARYTC